MEFLEILSSSSTMRAVGMTQDRTAGSPSSDVEALEVPLCQGHSADIHRDWPENASTVILGVTDCDLFQALFCGNFAGILVQVDQLKLCR